MTKANEIIAAGHTANTPWLTGNPPVPGWYVASTERCADCRRYWHGAHWSAPVFDTDPQTHHDRARNTMGETQIGVEWIETATATA